MCSCKGKKADRYVVKLQGGLKIPKNSEAAAKEFAAKHPGAVVIKASA